MKNITLNNRIFNYEDLSSLKEELSNVSVVISESAIIGNNVKIGNNVVIRDDARINSGAVIGKNIIIGHDVTIGENAYIDDNSTIIRSIVITTYRYTVCWYSNGYIQIGCKTLSIEQWKDQYLYLGIEFELTTQQIKEYKTYIDFCGEMQELV